MAQLPARMLRIEYKGQPYDWFDLDGMGDVVRTADFANTLRENIAHYFGVPLECQAVYDDDGPVATTVDVARALQNTHPNLKVHDIRQMALDLKDRTAQRLADISAEVARAQRNLHASDGAGRGANGGAATLPPRPASPTLDLNLAALAAEASRASEQQLREQHGGGSHSSRMRATSAEPGSLRAPGHLAVQEPLAAHVGHNVQFNGEPPPHASTLPMNQGFQRVLGGNPSGALSAMPPLAPAGGLVPPCGFAQAPCGQPPAAGRCITPQPMRPGPPAGAAYPQHCQQNPARTPSYTPPLRPADADRGAPSQPDFAFHGDGLQPGRCGAANAGAVVDFKFYGESAQPGRPQFLHAGAGALQAKPCEALRRDHTPLQRDHSAPAWDPARELAALSGGRHAEAPREPLAREPCPAMARDPAPPRDLRFLQDVPLSERREGHQQQRPLGPCSGVDQEEAFQAVDVLLSKEPGQAGHGQRFGFANVPARDGKGVLISWVDDHGLLGRWNRLYPDKAVSDGDRVVAVNGVSHDIDAMRAQLQHDVVRMTVHRRSSAIC